MADSSGSNGDATVRAKQHIQNLRKNKFSIGKFQQNPLTQDLHHAVTSLSAELYTKDVHFLMELIQNAEDNKYLDGVEPALEFVLTTTDITSCGAPATLLVFNNEIGFSAKNMDSICSVGRSTKKGLRSQGFIGEKGIGFKSVFLVSAQPHIFSNGYQVKFNELPTKGSGVGYIVPEWVDNDPSVADIQRIYGFDNILPTTTIILPLKPDKVEAVKKQLSEVHPEVLLFLSKIKRLSIRENSGDSPAAMDSVSSVAIASETSIVSLNTEPTDSRIVQLSVQEGEELNESTCRYFIWRQSFQAKPDKSVNGRNDVKEWVISLAFPFGERLKRGTSSVGIFAFLPTAMVTNFPFIVQADFILASSRETILLDSQWNLGILDCVPSCFVNAITSCVESTETSPFLSSARMLDFLPARESPFKELNKVRQSIKTMVQAERIIPCESFSKKPETFCRPTEVMRIFSGFRRILLHIKKRQIRLKGISSPGKFVLHSSVDHKEYDEVLDFIGVSSVRENYSWYGNCIKSCTLITRVPVDVYMELLCFFSEKWAVLPYRCLKNIPLLKYVTCGEGVAACSVSQIKLKTYKVHLVLEAQKHSWLNKWNVEMQCPSGTFFWPDETVGALLEHKRQHTLKNWLQYKVGVVFTTISQYCSSLRYFVTETKNPKLAVSLAHLVYHANLKQYIETNKIPDILDSLPIVDGSGKVHARRTKILVPSSGSKWAKLFGSNPFAGVYGNVEVEYCSSLDKYVELGEVYGEAANFGSESTKDKELLDFLVKYTGAIDLPDIPPLDVELKVAYSQLTSDQAILLLDWIHCLRGKGYGMPSRFIASITNGNWLKTYSGFHSPSICFLCDDNKEITLLMRNVLQHFPVVDKEFYGERIKSYIDELKIIGVSIGIEHMHVPIINHLQHRASFTMSKEWAIFLLHFIKILKAKYMLREELVKAAKEGEWLKSNRGYCTPLGSIFLKSNVEALLQITDLHVIDSEFYDGQIDCFINELGLLGVVIDLEGVLNLVPDNFQFPEDLSILKGSSILLVLRCIRHLGPAATGLMERIKDQPWMKTSHGLRRPSESVLPDKKWGHLLRVIPLPVIDEDVYGSGLKQYKAELKAVGVVVDLDGVTMLLSEQLKTLLSSISLTSDHVIATLNCMKCMGKSMTSQLLELRSCLLEEKWLKTLHGYRSAPDSVLFDSKWGTVAQFVDLPLIDEAFYGIGIYLYKDQLKMLGVVVDFSEGAHFIARGLRLPKEPAFMTADSALSLLECVVSLRMNPSNQFLLEELLNKLKGSKWLKTHLGYRSPEESLLFDTEWASGLENYDAPFIHESFYANFVSVGKDDLKAVGVKVDVEDVCCQISEMLNLHTQTCVIMRIYKFLNKFKWSPRLPDGSSRRIWIPDHHGIGGKWVDFRVCVLHDRDNLFHLRLHSLDRYYENELLSFLKLALGVAESPSIDDYVTLWNNWASSMHGVALSECTSFWEHISENWNSTTEEIMKNKITMLPATRLSVEGIEFVEKSEVFIPDDLQLKKLFTNVTVKPLFVWYPQDDPSSVSPTKLFDIYCSLGVRKISESVQFEPSFALPVGCKVEVVDSRDELIGKSLMKIVLGFFASHRINMHVEERHKTAETLLDISLVLTAEPIEVNYSLRIPSLERVFCVTTRRMVLWEKSSGRLIVKETSWNEQRNNIEFVTDFAQTVAEGLLPNKIDLVDNLCKLIQMGFAFGFKEDAVDFLLMKENLELSAADKHFLNSAFPPAGNSSSPVPLKRRYTSLDSLPIPEIPTQKRKKKVG